MRGVPSSGKSTLALQLAGKKGKIHSTDDYFFVDGIYIRDQAKLGEYHNRNFVAFCESLKQEVPIVVCDNTNSRRWEFERYIIAAETAGYSVEVVALPHPNAAEAAQRNAHNVPTEAIQRMLDKWED